MNKEPYQNNQNSALEKELKEMKVGDFIKLQLIFNETEKPYFIGLQVLELDKLKLIGKAKIVEIFDLKHNSDKRNLSEYIGKDINFKYSDIIDVCKQEFVAVFDDWFKCGYPRDPKPIIDSFKKTINPTMIFDY